MPGVWRPNPDYGAAYSEGAGAFKLVGWSAVNPYAREISRLGSLGKEADSKLYELKGAWEAGAASVRGSDFS